ncbi:thiamine phosphate synthase [Oecophyllibacter saccharovorans]|uniref:thiamine phosphate synthase n=1 Tax=Oecophyllibacter saccharovorans TaxID=2558360 RepID=UPI00116AF24C|nr:thiamine phosphate synthase [Oecophyllibacter saccharovorans]TPW34910.1 hypothetical protein E3203_05235 [Oecophyllibacter saccharovorans]
MTAVDTSESPPHQVDLYPVLPAILTRNAAALGALEKPLGDLLAAPQVTALRYCFSAPPYPPALDALLSLAQSHDVAVIAAPHGEDLQTLTRLINALPLEKIDGIHLETLAAFKALPPRKSGKNAFQIGCSCSCLDEAMRAGEAGADYVSFPAAETTLFQQWALMTELPSVAELLQDISPASLQPGSEIEKAVAAAQAGADFIAFPVGDSPAAWPENERLFQALLATFTTRA